MGETDEPMHPALARAIADTRAAIGAAFQPGRKFKARRRLTPTPDSGKVGG